MSRQLKGVKYRKFKSPDGGGYNTGRRRFQGRVHLQFFDKSVKAWRFVCGKRDGGAALMYCGAPGDIVEDEEPVTCVKCGKHAPDVVEFMDTIPDLDDFQ